MKSKIFEAPINFINELNKKDGNLKALIMGGAVADVFTGTKEPKDIDILVNGSKGISALYVVTNKLGGTIKRNVKGSGSGSGSAPSKKEKSNPLNAMRILGNYKVTLPNCDYEIDLIVNDIDPLERVKEFPCNRSMIWIDRTGTTEMLEPFLDFINGELMFFCTSRKEYRERMVGYFPDHKVVFNLGE